MATVTFDAETRSVLRAFANGEKSPVELEAWIISALDEMKAPEREALWELRLLLTETGEGLRPASKVRERVTELLSEKAKQ